MAVAFVAYKPKAEPNGKRSDRAFVKSHQKTACRGKAREDVLFWLISTSSRPRGREDRGLLLSVRLPSAAGSPIAAGLDPIVPDLLFSVRLPSAAGSPIAAGLDPIVPDLLFSVRH